MPDAMAASASSPFTRRYFLALCSKVGVTSTFFAGTLCALARSKPDRSVTRSTISQAALLAGIQIPPEKADAMVALLDTQIHQFDSIRKLRLANDVPPAFRFDPVLADSIPPAVEGSPARQAKQLSAVPAIADSEIPRNLESLAFATVRELGELIRRQKITSVDLTSMYLSRLKRFDPSLHFLIHLTEERALAQAQEADADLAKGRYRGPLHGLPWGAKDLLAVKGYPTTWGAGGFENQVFDTDATVVTRLDESGAVLVAKLTLGALAMNDTWFGGRTRNPWNLTQGSSGSSAGSAAAIAAGCVTFAIGSETLGSISSPSTRCGVTGYRPTFGFVPRTGAMALAWTMDKLGPIARSAEDCAIVMQAIYGPDGRDGTVRAAPFAWNADFDWKKLRFGFVKKDFEPVDDKEDKPEAWFSEAQLKKWTDEKPERDATRARQNHDLRYHRAALGQLRRAGVSIEAIDLPDLPWDAIAQLLNGEAAAAFDELTRTGSDNLLAGQAADDWPNIFRVARFFPAVEYLQANRARTLAMRQMRALFEKFDLLITLNSGPQLTVTNLTGHPAVIVPDGLRDADAPAPAKLDKDVDDNIGGPGTPTSLTFVGNLYQDASLLAVAHGFQQMTNFHRNRPPKF
jgi:Asp-tRNA(Asn)/Glu-tRNA(Gln) amidotransferase A subunit family amidase